MVRIYVCTHRADESPEDKAKKDDKKAKKATHPVGVSLRADVQEEEAGWLDHTKTLRAQGITDDATLVIGVGAH